MVSASRSGEAMNGQAIVVPSFSSDLDSRPKPVRTTPEVCAVGRHLGAALLKELPDKLRSFFGDPALRYISSPAA